MITKTASSLLKEAFEEYETLERVLPGEVKKHKKNKKHLYGKDIMKKYTPVASDGFGNDLLKRKDKEEYSVFWHDAPEGKRKESLSIEKGRKLLNNSQM